MTGYPLSKLSYGTTTSDTPLLLRKARSGIVPGCLRRSFDLQRGEAVKCPATANS